MSKILRIVDESFGNDSREGYRASYDGFQIVCDDETIKLGIENGQNCCERWGYLMSEDNFDQFIGAEIISVERVDAACKVYGVEYVDEEDSYGENSCMFVNINTSKGLLQFVAYNSHNGYYSHDAVVISRSLNISEYL